MGSIQPMVSRPLLNEVWALPYLSFLPCQEEGQTTRHGYMQPRTLCLCVASVFFFFFSINRVR